MRPKSRRSVIVLSCFLVLSVFLIVTHAQAKIATSTKLTSSLNPSVFGQSVTFTAKVLPASGTGTPTGTVAFTDGSNTVTKTLSGGVATLTTSALNVGTHSITATYSGDSNYSGSTSPVLRQVVNKANTTTTLSCSPNPSTYGQSVTCIAAVAPSTATGSVSFYDGSTLLGSGTLSSGSASLTIASLSVGSHSIKAVYSGDGNYNGSTSNIVSQVVNKANTITTLSCSPNPSNYGQLVTCIATVSPSTATGTASFYDGSILLGTVSLSGGSTSFSTSSLTSGSHAITAVYSGDGNYNSSTSNVVTQVVVAVLTSITVSPQGLSVAVGSAGQPYTAEGNYNDGSQQNLTNSVTWTSSSPGVATISSGGVESAVAQGSTTIKASQGSIAGTSSLAVYAANTFFVATDGNDTWSGTLSAPNSNNSDGPFASPSRAQSAIEAASKPAAVVLRNGTYYLALTPPTSNTYAGPLVLNKASDSGSSSGAQVTWQSYPGETPMISGGVPANSDGMSGIGLHLTWTHTGNVYQATLPTTLPNGVALQDFEYLYYKGQRRLRSRIHDASSASMGYYMSSGTCTASPNTPPNQSAPSLASCNLGTYLRVVSPVTFSSPPTICPYATSNDTTPVYKCLDRFTYADTTGGDPITNWMNLHGTVISGQPCTAGTNSYPAGDIELTLIDAWTVDVMRVNCVDTTNKIIYLLGSTKGSGITASTNYNYFGPTKGHRYLIENTLDAFNTAATNGQVGLWFLDRSGSHWVLNYIADTLHGENPPTDNIVIPQLGGTIPGAPATDYTGGSLLSATQLNYVTFSGITFEVDNFIPDAIGFNNDVNGEMPLPQAIDCESCQNVIFNGITVRHTSASGILIASTYGYQGVPATADTVENSSFYDLGDSGVRIGHTPVKTGNADNGLYVVNNIIVQNNRIQGYSRVFADGEGIAEGNGNSNTFINNTIDDGYHAGISVCFNGCGPTPKDSNGLYYNVDGNNIVSKYNLIYNLMQGITSDGGSLYYNIGNGNSSGSGNKILSNVVYDTTDSYIIDNTTLVGYQVDASAYGGEGIYLDAQSANVDVEDNVVYNVDGNAIHLTEGLAQGANVNPTLEQPNMFINNIFAFADKGMFSQGTPWVQGCPASGSTVTEVDMTNNIFNFDKPNSNNSTFQVVQGCTNACGEAYNVYQKFQNNAYYNTISDFSKDTNAFQVLQAQGISGLNSKNACLASPYFPLTFSAPSCSWQNGMSGTMCTNSGGQTKTLAVTMDEDMSGVIYNAMFPATGQSTDPRTDYSFSTHGLTGPPTPFVTGLTDDAISKAGSSVPDPGTVLSTFPTYVYMSF
jgi:hypothetical protein